MTRRDFLWAAAATGVRTVARVPLVVPVHRVMDARAQCTPEQLHRFWWSTWPEAVRTFSGCGMDIQCTDQRGEIRRSPAERPIFVGLERGAINLVLTDRLPMTWDHGRALAGVTTLHGGYCLCAIALSYAHGHQVPFLSVNTCVHEMLHVLLGDVFLSRSGWLKADGLELRNDWYATRMWLFRDGSVRESAGFYLARLRPSATFGP